MSNSAPTEITTGQKYLMVANGQEVVVVIKREDTRRGGWIAFNTTTGYDVRVASADLLTEIPA